MNERSDRELDLMLRDLGPEVPEPRLGASARDELVAAALGLRGSTPGRRRVWQLAAGIALVLGVSGSWIWLGAELRTTRAALTRTAWESGETLKLLTLARQGQPSVGFSDEIGASTSGDLVVLTFDHELCPIAAQTTPAFEALAARHTGARFELIDVTGERRVAAEERIRGLGLSAALLAPIGGETGVVKVIDTSRGLVLSSAPGRVGLEQAERVLAAVDGARPSP